MQIVVQLSSRSQNRVIVLLHKFVKRARVAGFYKFLCKLFQIHILVNVNENLLSVPVHTLLLQGVAWTSQAPCNAGSCEQEPK